MTNSKENVSDVPQAELKAINERLIISFINQHEEAETARQGEQKAKADLKQMSDSFDELEADCSEFKATHAASIVVHGHEHETFNALNTAAAQRHIP